MGVVGWSRRCELVAVKRGLFYGVSGRNLASCHKHLCCICINIQVTFSSLPHKLSGDETRGKLIKKRLMNPCLLWKGLILQTN